MYKRQILCAPEGASVFKTSATDNIVRPEELRRLAYEWEEHKLEEVSQLVWAHAQDLALWCLQTDPSRRPSSSTGGRGSSAPAASRPS